MKTMSFAASLGMLALLCGAAAGATLADLELNDLWSGEAWNAEALKDRVVVVEFWGLN